MEGQIIENGILEWTPEFELTESADKTGAWFTIGGTALVEGVSKNNNRYTLENLQENNGKEFKWLVGHPRDSHPDHVVGKGKLAFEDGVLKHGGKIKNTSAYPDIVEKVQEGLIGPSIHASFDKMKKVPLEEGAGYEVHVEGLSIDGIGLVAFQGVKQASIDYAIAESFDKIAKEEKLEEEKIEVNTMVEENNAKQESLIAENEQLKKQLEEMKLAEKKKLVESLIKLNKELNDEELMKKEESVLELMIEYEKKLMIKEEEESKPEAEAEPEGEAVQEPAEEEKPAEEEPKAEEQFVIERDGSVTLSKETYKKFNEEIKTRI